MTLMLVGILAPVALAISAPAPHACCMRKPMHDPGTQGRAFNAPNCCNHDCCHAVTVTQSPHLLPAVMEQVAASAALLRRQRPATTCICLTLSTHSGRAPPLFSFA
ncbi:MAG TPA: hypothetical protein VEK33_23795 [Terriglobales bacterium]|nr:hypothetical protein [Terriglobales bacterium]